MQVVLRLGLVDRAHVGACDIGVRFGFDSPRREKALRTRAEVGAGLRSQRLYFPRISFIRKPASPAALFATRCKRPGF
jgi:hypothetical protein